MLNGWVKTGKIDLWKEVITDNMDNTYIFPSNTSLNYFYALHIKCAV